MDVGRKEGRKEQRRVSERKKKEGMGRERTHEKVRMKEGKKE